MLFRGTGHWQPIYRKGLSGRATASGPALTGRRDRRPQGRWLALGPLPPRRALRLKGNSWLANTIGNPLATTIALQHLIFEGTLDRFPGLKIIAAHGGGYLPSYAPRSDHACFVAPQNCNPDIKLKKKPTEYLNQLHFDSLVFTPEGLRHLVAQVSASQIMLGSDHPIPWEEHPVDHVFATATLSDEEKAAILGDNAARLLGIQA